MTALAAILRAAPVPVSETPLLRMLGAAASRGGDRFAHVDGMIGVEWSAHDPVAVAQERGCTVVADAALYYTDDLCRALRARGVAPAGDQPAALILAAYEAWGERCAEHLEGDFAFILWDNGRRRLVAARDFGGKRPLHYAESNGSLLLGSTVGCIAAHPDAPRELDLREIAADAAGLLFADRTGTCYRGVHVLPAGHTLTWTPGQQPARSRHWTPPVFSESADAPPFREASAQLRSLLIQAILERMPDQGPAAVWLSGGWDSTAVYGSGQIGVRSQGNGDRLRAVSISYPEGDPGREDELIRAVASHWGAPVQWIEIESIPLLRDPAREAASRDEPFAHAFEHWNRSLARESAALGCRIAFDGCGGDQLFQVSNVLLADLLRRGRIAALAREWRAKGMRGSGARGFFQWAVEPLMPAMAMDLVARARGGRRYRGYLERDIPPFIRADFVRAHDLEAYTRPAASRHHANPVANEHEMYLSSPFFPRVFSALAGLALDEGVELRSPLYDQRIIAFAATRPVAERSDGAETKRLLRSAMQGLLPESVLQRRRERTGTTRGFFARAMREQFGSWLDDLLDRPLLADLGVVEPRHIRASWEWYRKTGHDAMGVALFFTLQTELWLRSHGGQTASHGTAVEPGRTLLSTIA